MKLASLGSLATATFLLIGGAFEAGRTEGMAPGGAVLLAAGLITLGVWLALEVRHHDRRPPCDDSD